MLKFLKEIWLLEANGHKFSRKPMFPKTISPHSLKNHVFPWQMGPSSQKKYVARDKWAKILLNKHGFLMFPWCPRQSVSLEELWAHLQVP